MQVDGQPRCCFFSFAQKFQANRIVRAQLWVYLRPAAEATTVFLQISRLMPVTDGNRHIRIRSLKIDVSAGVSSWQSIDVKQVLSVWLRQPETNWGIEINAFDSRGKDLAVTTTESGEEGLVSCFPPTPPPRALTEGTSCPPGGQRCRCLDPGCTLCAERLCRVSRR